MKDLNTIEAVEKSIFECMEWMESIVRDMLEEYENKETYTDCEEYRREGAVGVLEELLEIIKGN